MIINLFFAWCWILAGFLTGLIHGLFFHDENWLGGYGSWRRRIMRLGHVAFFGTGFINLLAAITVKLWPPPVHQSFESAVSILLIVGAVTMSLICYLSAWRKNFRRLFFIPVASLILGVIGLIVMLFRSAL